ncbi:hypothetical protein [Konateibacter massiliensis]|nr:hypothetical protein [Konateibacter massiliensis]
MKWKLFCTITMGTYHIEADSLYSAKKQLAAQLGVPVSCIDDYR